MTEQAALVVATYSRRMRLSLPDSRRVDARIKGKRIKPVCGDYVEAEPIAGESDWLITAICERRNQLTRPNLRGKIEQMKEKYSQDVELTVEDIQYEQEPEEEDSIETKERVKGGQ